MILVTQAADIDRNIDRHIVDHKPSTPDAGGSI